MPGHHDEELPIVHAPELVEKATAASSMKGNPLPLTADELTAVLKAAL